MKLYDLSYSYFFFSFCQLKGFFWGVKIKWNLVAVGLNGTSRCSIPQVAANNNHFDFFLYFPLLAVFLNSVQNCLSTPSVWYIIEICFFFRISSGQNLLALCPHYTNVQFCQAAGKLSRQLDCGPLTVPFRRLADLIKDNQSILNAPSA